MLTPSFIHDLIDRATGPDHPHAHWWIDLVTTLVLVVAPAWTAWLAARSGLRWAGVRREHARTGTAAAPRPAAPLGAALPSGRREVVAVRLEGFVLGATSRLQLRLVLLSVLTLPTAWLLLEIPKHIINHALADAASDGHPKMSFLGFDLGRVELLFALCASYLAVLTLSGLAKYAVNLVRGRVNERLVRRLRLAIAGRARGERSQERRATLAAVAVQEVEPIGYFGGSLVAVPLVQGGTLATSIVFLLTQNAALAIAALIMLPVQLTILPRLQARLNAKVRRRVHATRALGALLTGTGAERRPGEAGGPSTLSRQMRQARELERVRIEINDLKGRLKGLYNYTANLTPFFFFSIGGFLVVEGRLSLGALVAALAAYKEIAPAMRELFDFAQDWSDATARFEEVTKALAQPVRDRWERGASTRAPAARTA